MNPSQTAPGTPGSRKPPPAPGSTPAVEPWWRVGMVWLVVGGPAVVVVAAVATGVIAYRGADTVVKLPQQLQAYEQPALKARNHAAAPESSLVSPLETVPAPDTPPVPTTSGSGDTRGERP
jgi:uncharacterized protein